jgi:hypothetical protein
MSLQGRFIYLPFAREPYLGGNNPLYLSPNKKDWPSPSKYHAGLLSSRLFAGVEILLVIAICFESIRLRGVPLSLEHDGVLALLLEDATERMFIVVKSLSLSLIGPCGALWKSSKFRSVGSALCKGRFFREWHRFPVAPMPTSTSMESICPTGGHMNLSYSFILLFYKK